MLRQSTTVDGASVYLCRDSSSYDAVDDRSRTFSLIASLTDILSFQTLISHLIRSCIIDSSLFHTFFIMSSCRRPAVDNRRPPTTTKERETRVYHPHLCSLTAIHLAQRLRAAFDAVRKLLKSVRVHMTRCTSSILLNLRILAPLIGSIKPVYRCPLTDADATVAATTPAAILPLDGNEIHRHHPHLRGDEIIIGIDGCTTLWQ